MTPFETALIIYGVILSLTTLGVVYRMIVGPTILDRAVSTDSLLVLMVLGMALYSAHALENWAGPAMLSMAGLAFVGTVTFARFVAREDRPQGHRLSGEDEPDTSTGPFDAIHFDNGYDSDQEQWPANQVEPTPAPVNDVAPTPTPVDDVKPAPAPVDDVAPIPAPVDDGEAREPKVDEELPDDDETEGQR